LKYIFIHLIIFINIECDKVSNSRQNHESFLSVFKKQTIDWHVIFVREFQGSDSILRLPTGNHETVTEPKIKAMRNWDTFSNNN